MAGELPDYVSLTDLASHGLTVEDVREYCPHAVEYGPANAPYWHIDDLAWLLGTREDSL